MPAPRLISLVCALLLAAIVAACGGGDNGDDTATSTRTPTASRLTDAPSPDGDKTPGPGESPEVTPADSGTAKPTPAPLGTPAVAPSDQSGYLAQFSGRTINFEECIYNPSTYVTDCPNRGKFAVDPPLTGQDVTCRIGIVEDTPEFINCQSQDPIQSIYYEIQ